MMLRRSILLLSLVVTLGLSGQTFAAPASGAFVLTASNADASGYCMDGDEQAVLQLINNYRAQNGLGQLVAVQVLGAAADYHSFDMATNNYFSHTLSSGISWSQNMTNFGYPTGGWRGENIAAGYPTPQSVFDGWRASPGHNATMLDPSAKAIGVGFAYNANSGFGSYWTTDFGDIITSAAVLCGGNPIPTATSTPSSTNTPTPQPTATQAPLPTSTPAPVAAVYVAGLSGKATGKGKSTTISVNVAVNDTNGAAVSGAGVTLVLSAPDGTSQTLATTTNRRGQASVSVKATHGSGMYVASVTNVAASSRPYDPSRNAASSIGIMAP
jgi:uncharacterized protein YkwD